jgi:hypothetical protein
MRTKTHDWFFYGLCSALGLIAGLVLLISLASAPSYAQAGGCFKAIDVMAMLRRDGLPFELFSEKDQVERGAAYISERSKNPLTVEPDAIFLVDVEGQKEAALSVNGIVCIRVPLTEMFARDLKAAILGKAQTRDA